MPDPRAARSDEEGRRFYTWKGETFWSVTTIISGGVPKHLQAWYGKIVAELAYADVELHGKRALKRWNRAGRLDLATRQADGELRSFTPAKIAKMTDRDFGLRWLKGEPERIRDAAGERGKAVHGFSEDLVLEHAREAVRLKIAGLPLPDWPPEIEPYMTNGLIPWLTRYEPEILATEFTIFSRSESYAGTGDVIVRIPIGDQIANVLVDYKSGNRIYPAVGMQLSAYRRGEFVGLDDGETEAPLPPIDATAVLHLRPTGRSPFRLVRSTDDVFRAFLFAREVYRFQTEIAPSVLGPEVAVPGLDDLGTLDAFDALGIAP